MEKIWPYILPLPIKPVKHDEVLRTVFGSKAALEILRRIPPGQKIYQKDLVSQSKFSNKTVIGNLKKLVSTGILEQGMDRVKVQGKAVWTKWYTPTFLGKWIILLLLSPKDVSREDAEAILRELFKIYADNAVKLCVDYGISYEIFKSAFDNAYLKKRLEEEKITPARFTRVIVYGSAALDIVALIDKIPKPDEAIYVKETMEFPGGSGANVAVALSRLGVSVSFVGKLGNDAAGRLLFDEFKNEGVESSGVVFDSSLITPRSFIIVKGRGEKRIYILGGKNVALSITTPREVDWARIEKCDLVYIGEVFVEIAELIASFAKSHGKIVVYRPGMPYLEFGLEKLVNVLRNVNVIIMNKSGWEVLIENSKGLESPKDLLTLGSETVIITKGYEGCEAYTREKSFKIPAFEVRAIDTTGAGDVFAASFIKALLDGKSIEECVRFASAAAALSTTKIGIRNSLPTIQQVEEFYKSR